MSSPAHHGDPRTILITGASSGIGRATAERFAARGWQVFASMRNPERGAALRARAAEAGWRLTTPPLDVTSDASVATAVAHVLREAGGRLDVLVNNAGYYAFGALEEFTDEEVLDAMEVAFREFKLVVEPGGAVALAAALTGKLAVKGRAVAVVCWGGNVDHETFRRALSRHAA